MKKQTFRIIKDYKSISNAKLVSRSTNVYNGINSNVNVFPNPPVVMADLLAQITNLEQAMVSAQHRDRLQSAKKNMIVGALIIMLDKLAGFATAIAAAGDPEAVESTLLLSGFSVNAIAVAGEFGPIAGFSVTVTPVSGQVKCTLNKVDGASSYTYCFGIDNGLNTVWQHINYTKTRLTISSLQAGMKYAFKVQATKGNEKSCESDVISRMVA